MISAVLRHTMIALSQRSPSVFSLRRRPPLQIFAVLSLIAVVFLIVQMKLRHSRNVTYMLSYEGSGYESCIQPILDPMDESVRSYITSFPPYECGKTSINDLVYVDYDGVVRFNKTVLRNEIVLMYGNNTADMSCVYSIVNREADQSIVHSPPVIFKPPTVIPADFFKVECRVKGLFKTNVIFSQILYNIHNNSHKKQQSVQTIRKEKRNQKPRRKHSKRHPNIMIVGTDSVSQLNSLRKLKKTNSFLSANLDTVTMRGYHVVDSQTYGNVVAMLTGQSEAQVQSRFLPQDDLPIIWNDFEKQGYVSLYTEDRPGNIMTFNSVGPGFSESPCTHYMRPYWLAIEKEHPTLPISPIVMALENTMKISGYSLCYKNKAYFDILMDYTSRFYHAYTNTPKFSMTWFNGPSHDHMNMVEILDNSLYNWFKSLNDNGQLDNTIVFLLGDHGHRTDLIRQTLVGRIEERQPFLSISLPKSFKDNGVLHNLQSNRDQLVTAYDIHETLREIIKDPNVDRNHVPKDSNNYKRNTVKQYPHRRAESLFKKIPNNRTCSDVGINHTLCACFYKRPVEQNDKILPVVIDYLLNRINRFRIQFTVKVKKIIKAEIIKPGSQLLYIDNRDTWFRHSPVNGVFVLYKLSIMTETPVSVYEGTVLYRMDSARMSLYQDIELLWRKE